MSETLTRSFDPEILAEAWETAALCIAPKNQRCGLGTMLLKWGLEQAAAEDVPVYAQTSHAAVAVYERSGFRSVKRLRFGDFELDGGGMHHMVWQAPGAEGRWFERAKEKADREHTGELTGAEVATRFPDRNKRPSRNERLSTSYVARLERLEKADSSGNDSRDASLVANFVVSRVITS